MKNTLKAHSILVLGSTLIVGVLFGVVYLFMYYPFILGYTVIGLILSAVYIMVVNDLKKWLDKNSTA